MHFLKYKWKDIVLPLFLFLITFFVYLHNLSGSVFGGDVGDFLTAIVVKGVPHPSGYPLFIILGIIFNYLPIADTPAFKVGLISALFSSISVVLMYFFSLEISQKKIVSFITALTLAFFYIFWLYAEIAEVFALTNFFILLLMFLGIKYYVEKKTKYLYLLSFFAGLSLSNHEIILAIFPSLLFLVLAARWKVIYELKTVIKCIILFVLGLTPYLYIPLAAMQNPYVNWDNATNLTSFLRLVLRQDYGWGVSATNTDLYVRLISLKTYLLSILRELTVASDIIMLLGAIYLIKLKKFVIFFAIFLGFLLIGPVYLVYGFTPIYGYFIQGVLQRFYMLSALFLLMFFPMGVVLLLNVISSLLKKINVPKRRISHYYFLFVLLFLLIPVSLFSYNFSKTDLHDDWTGDNFGKDLLSPLPKGSVLLIQGDSGYFNTEYVQYALNFRKDITLINLGALDINSSIVAAEKSVTSSNKNLPKDAMYIKSILEVAKNKPLYSTQNLEYRDKKYGNLVWQPYGLGFKLITDNKKLTEEEFLLEQQKAWKLIHIPKISASEKSSSHNLTLADIYSTYAQAYVRIGNYLISNYSDFDKAKTYFEISTQLDPNLVSGYKGLGYYFLDKNECGNAEKAFSTMIQLDPGYNNAYVLLYGTYITCSKDLNKANMVSELFKNKFRLDIKSQFDKQRYNVNN